MTPTIIDPKLDAKFSLGHTVDLYPASKHFGPQMLFFSHIHIEEKTTCFYCVRKLSARQVHINILPKLPESVECRVEFMPKAWRQNDATLSHEAYKLTEIERTCDPWLFLYHSLSFHLTHCCFYSSASARVGSLGLRVAQARLLFAAAPSAEVKIWWNRATQDAIGTTRI